MALRYRICSMRGELRNPKDLGSSSLIETVNAAESLVKGGHAFPGLTVYEWTYGSKAATITPDGTNFHEH
jgi:hypothetical protein